MLGIIRSSKGSRRQTHLSAPQLKCRYTKGIKASVLVIDKCLPAKAISRPQGDSPGSSFDIIISSSSTSEEKFICLWGYWQSRDDRKFKWYALPLDDDLGNRNNNFGFGGAHEIVKLPDGKVTNKLEPFSEARLPNLATTVAIGSTIYCLGGLADGTGCDAPDLKFFDTNHPEHSWMVGPPMAIAQVEPWAAVLHGKIYVLDGLDSNERLDRQPWMEVFDPRTMEWTTLKPPPEFPPYLRSFHAFGSDQIFVDPKEDSESGSGLYLCFDVEEHKWKAFNDETLESGPPGDPDLSLSHCPEPVVHERTLYWYLGTELFAYDLEAKKWFYSGSIQGLEVVGVPQLWRAKLDPRLFHLDGDLFCLLWQDKKRVHDNESDESLLPLHCTKVRVSKTGSNFTGGCGFLSAYVVSSRSFLVECGIPMGGAVLVDRKLDEEQKLADTLELDSKNSSRGLHDGVLGTIPGGALAAGAMHLFRSSD